MTLKKVSPGQPFRPLASTWNQFVDAANAYAAQSGPGMSGGESPWQRNPGSVWVLNNTSAVLSQYSVVGLSGLAGHVPASPPWTPDDASLVVFGVDYVTPGLTPSVLQQALAPGEIGRAVVSGVTPAYVYVEFEGHEWGYRKGDEYFTTTYGPFYSAPSGEARILWRAGGVGYQQAVVLLGEAPAHGRCASFSCIGGQLRIQISGRFDILGSVWSDTQNIAMDVTPGVGVGITVYRRTDVSDANRQLFWCCNGDLSAGLSPDVVPVDTGIYAESSSTRRRAWMPGNIHAVVICQIAVLTNGTAIWVTPPPEVVRVAYTGSTLTYSEHYQRIMWWEDISSGVTSDSSSLDIPPSTNGIIYAVGSWGALPSLSLSIGSEDWSQRIGRIETDADGHAIQFDHESPNRLSMVRYEYHP